MEIYVENNTLMCAPFGRPREGENNFGKDVLEYTGINPFNVTDWQHISCTFIKDHYVKG